MESNTSLRPKGVQEKSHMKQNTKTVHQKSKVTGDNILKVNRGKQKKNDDDAIGY